MNIDSPKYTISPKIDKKIKVLIFHDSFFDNSYSPHAYLEDYFFIDFKKWNKNINLNNENFENYDFIIFESSVDIFFESRIYTLKNKFTFSNLGHHYSMLVLYLKFHFLDDIQNQHLLILYFHNLVICTLSQ